MHKIRIAINQINRLASILAGILTAAIGLVVCYAVFARYVINRPVGWSEEIGTYLMIWAAFLGAGYTMQMDGHIGVDVVCKKLPLGFQAKLSIARYVVGIVFLILLAWKGFADCALSIKLGQVSISELAIPMFIPQMALPVGAVMIVLQLVEKLIRQFAGSDSAGETGA